MILKDVVPDRRIEAADRAQRLDVETLAGATGMALPGQQPRRREDLARLGIQRRLIRAGGDEIGAGDDAAVAPQQPLGLGEIMRRVERVGVAGRDIAGPTQPRPVRSAATLPGVVSVMTSASSPCARTAARATSALPSVEPLSTRIMIAGSLCAARLAIVAAR